MDLSWIKENWVWLQKNDVPNSVTVAFTAIFWPLALILYSHIRARRVPGLEVCIEKREKIIVDHVECAGIGLRFLNKTGSVVYLHNPRILGCTDFFLPHPKALREISESSYELKFKDEKNGFDRRQMILQTDGQCETVMPLSVSPSDDLLSYKCYYWRWVLKRQKYFRLEFLALVGNKRYNVRMRY